MGPLFGIIWPVLWRFLAVVAVVAAVWWTWDHFVKDPYVEQGVKQEHVNTVLAEGRAKVAEDANLELAKDVLGLKDKVGEANAALKKLADADKLAMDNKNRLLAALAVKEKSARAEIARLLGLTGKPSATPEIACEEATAILDALSLRRNGAVPTAEVVQ